MSIIYWAVSSDEGEGSIKGKEFISTAPTHIQCLRSITQKREEGGNVEFLINAHWYVKTTGRFKSLLNIKHTKSPALRIRMFARGHVVPQSPIVGARCKKYTIVYIPVFLR